MSNYLLGFKNKKERDDFFIALIVLLFFAWLMYFFVFNKKTVDVLSPEKAAAELVDGKKDRDGDGVADRYDKCPNLKGDSNNQGCPLDQDGDGVYDEDDNCPKEAGLAENKGCPADSDGDGVADNKDKCPKIKGSASNNGCPLDTDGDGINDKEDKCPELAGIAQNNGCPSDRDRDGVYDTEDKCPNMAGKASNNGCPEVKLEEAEAEVLKTALKAVEFETGSAYLKRNSYASLRNILEILQKYPKYKLAINGHTDNTGQTESNQKLSEDRAKKCYEYFVEKGIATNRLTYKGFGETQPMDTNDTAEGKANNRRVEFKLSY